MKFLIVVVSCLAVANASAIWAHGHHGALVGASGVVTGHGASGPSGVVTGHGAVGPLGDHSSHGHIAHVGHVAHAYVHGHDDGQWHGEGLLESQDWAGHHGIHGAVVAPHSVVVGHHGLGLAHGHAAVVAAPAVVAHGHHGHWLGHHHW
ncbi:hypothetical protein FQR65_LT05958 [Abscondita terminalis]|nr:hypothetical protein FQR65_LT05958 [Abscondita terminalis]